MIRYFLKLTIRFKLLVAFGSILLISASLIAFAFYSINSMNQYYGLSEKVNDLSANILKLNTLTTEFINTGYKSEDFLKNEKSDLLISCNQSFEEIESLILELRNNKLLNADMADLSSEFEDELLNYRSVFDQLVDTYKIRGFKDYGLEGELRMSIHSVENSGQNYDRALMLMLRRHEKDFFLRKDLKYLDKFNAGIVDFLRSFDESDNFEMDYSSIKSSIRNYKEKFAGIVGIEEEIGLTAETGLRGELAESASKNDQLAATLSRLIKDKNRESINQTFLLLPILLFLQILIGMVLILFYAKMFTKAITEIRDAAQSLSNGVFPEKLSIRTKDEISETKLAFNNLIERIHTAADFAENLGNGNLSVDYDERYSNDVLAKSIIDMQQQMKISEGEREKINWSNRGLALFNDILRSEDSDVKTLGNSIIQQMVKYLDANQGALFVLDNNIDPPIIRRIATYAYDRQKQVDQEIMIGEGLVGQAVQEKDTLFLTDVPDRYTSITSGLGYATPNSLLIVPLKMNEVVMGVIELASFKIFEKFEIEFVEKISETIANILLNKSNNERNKKLLEEAKEKAEMLAHQEEELRQNSEELMATQEEMKRQRTELEREIELLKNQLKERIISN